MLKLFRNHTISASVCALYFLSTLAQAQLRYQVLTQPTLSKQTGLYEQTLRITNDFNTEQRSLRVFAQNLPAGVELWNKSGEDAGAPYLDLLALAPGESQELKFQYYDRTRSKLSTLDDFTIDGATTGSTFRFTGGLGGQYTGHFGDIDGDDKLTANDVLRVRQHINGLVPLDAITEEPNADYDHDGEITATDAELIAKAAIKEQLYPSLISPTSGSPGRLVDIYDPALANMSDSVKVMIAGLEMPDIHRSYPGSVTVMIPPHLTTSGVINIVLEVGGVPVATHLFDLEITPASSPADYRLQLSQVVGAMERTEAEFALKLDAYYESNSVKTLFSAGSTPQLEIMQIITLRKALEAARVVKKLIDEMPDEALSYAIRGFQSNFSNNSNLLEALNEDNLNSITISRSMVTSSVSSTDAAFLRETCELEDLISRFDTYSGYITNTCIGLTAVAVACLFVPFIGPLCGAAFFVSAVSACASWLLFEEIRQIVFDFIPKISTELLVEGPAYATGSSGSTMANFTVYAEVDFFWRRLCKTGGSGVIEKNIVEQLLELALERALKKSAVLRGLYETVEERLPALKKQIDDDVEDFATETGAQIFTNSGLGEAITEYVEAGCAHLPSGKRVDLDHTKVKAEAIPNEGTFSKTTDSITYTCSNDNNAAPTITINFELEACKQKKTGKATVLCEEEKDVTFTIGDNGNLLDDIFELRINGESVLTSSSPVRSASKTLKLAVGEHQMQMFGRAAPDNVGTYFVTTGIARVLSGPSLSGSDLTAGRLFTWTIIVD